MRDHPMYINISIEELIDWCKDNNPDKMLLEDGDAFLRGKIAGKVELIDAMVMYLTDTEDDDEEQEDG